MGIFQVANYGIAGQYDTHYDATMMGKDAAADLQRRTVFNHYAGDRMLTVSQGAPYGFRPTNTGGPRDMQEIWTKIFRG